jgi:hypothetical protein
MEEEQRITADELRQVAHFVEETAFPALASYYAIPVPLAIGGVKEFPRPSREDAAAEQGVDALRAFTEQSVAALFTLAQALDNELDVPPSLLILVQPHIDAFRIAGGQRQGSEQE